MADDAPAPKRLKSSRRKRKRAWHLWEKAGRSRHTGLDPEMAPFFLGGDSKVGGFMHYTLPRKTREYEKMRVAELSRRIQFDLRELLARAYPNYFEDWTEKFAPGYDFAISYRDRLRRVIHEGIAESLCQGLMQRIRSTDESVRKSALREYFMLVDRLLVEEPQHAANAVAFITKWAATYLENLFVRRGALMREVAAKYDLWPVNLGLRDKKKGSETKRQLQRVGFARDYLTELSLNSACVFPSTHESGAERVSPFRLAAENVYITLLMIKNSEGQGFFLRLTPWAKKLLKLSAPMTKSTALDWWKIAKVYVDERWQMDRSEFAPLVKHLRLQLSSRTPYESTIKRRVIDNDLKDAFLGLAQPDL